MPLACIRLDKHHQAIFIIAYRQHVLYMTLIFYICTNNRSVYFPISFLFFIFVLPFYGKNKDLYMYNYCLHLLLRCVHCPLLSLVIKICFTRDKCLPLCKHEENCLHFLPAVNEIEQLGRVKLLGIPFQTITLRSNLIQCECRPKS